MTQNALKGVSGAALAAYALTFQGVRYVWGGTSPSGFDCSGFAQYVYRHRAGIELPRQTYAQATVGVDVLGGPYLPGDLLFFHGSEHEGISLGGSSFVHAPHTGDVVKISRLGGGYQPNAARRVLSDSQAGAGKVSGVAVESSEPASWGGWARRFLAELGAPVSGPNLQFVLGWMRAENPSSDYSWNPLATTLRTKASLKSGGVQAYKDESSGLDATVQTIQSGQYGAVRRALASGSSSQATWDALRASPWDAGHYASTPSPPYQSSDATRLVVGAKKGGGGGILGAVEGAAGDALHTATDPFGLVGAGTGLVTGAVGSVTDPVVGAVESAAGAVGSAIESTAIRVGYILVGLMLGGFALVLVVRTVSGGSGMPGAGGAAGAIAGAVPELAVAAV